MIFLIPGIIFAMALFLLCAVGQWLATLFGHRRTVWIFPIVVHSLALLAIIDTHADFNGSEAADSGGAAGAVAEFLLFAYGAVGLSAVLTVVALPGWMRKGGDTNPT